MDPRDHTATTSAANLPSSYTEEEEAEEQTLIAQHDRDVRNAPSRFFSTTFRLPNSIRSFNFNYLLPIFLPLLLLSLLTSIDLRDPFKPSTLPSPPHNSLPSDRMRESELRALRLLTDQQLALLDLWNHRASLSNSTYLTSPLRKKLLESITLNTEIQKELLQQDGNVDVDRLPDPGVGTCRKMDRQPPRNGSTVEWKPRRGRYLLAVCVAGHFWNRLLCLRKHMLFAAVLNRVLVFPSWRFDYRYERLIDVDRINDCVGRKVVVSFEEFARTRKRGKRLHVDRFLCYMANPPCSLEEGQLRKLKWLGLSLPKLEVAWPEDAKLGTVEKKERVVRDIRSRFSCMDEVLAVGDLLDADVEEEMEMQPGGPVSRRCEALIQPNHIINQTAERFVQTYLGRGFVAVHFRRRGFLSLCNEKDESCFFPVPQAAECILQVAEKVDSQIIYLSTDAGGSEIALLQSLLVSNKKVVPLIRKPKHSHAEKWDSLLYMHHVSGDDQVVAMLDRMICAMSAVFVGSSGSAFTEDIIRMRKDWGLTSTCDEYLCEGKRPNFIASKE